jgi:hypothetical protein
MSTDDQAGASAGGIRNGGLLLVLVALAAVVALVDRPPEPGAGRSLPGVVQHLPPPAGITGQPPVTSQPPVSPGGTATALAAGQGERPASGDRAHPNRTHPRPARSGSLGGDAPTRPAGAGGGSGGTGTTRPPVTTPPVAAVPSVGVRVPPVGVRVRPPSLLGRDLGDVRAETPGASVATPAVQLPRLG